MQPIALRPGRPEIETQSTLSRMAATAARWLSHRQARRRQRATARILHGLSDRTLKDIGLDRSEIESLSRPGDASRSPHRISIGIGRFG